MPDIALLAWQSELTRLCDGSPSLNVNADSREVPFFFPSYDLPSYQPSESLKSSWSSQLNARSNLLVSLGAIDRRRHDVQACIILSLIYPVFQILSSCAQILSGELRLSNRSDSGAVTLGTWRIPQINCPHYWSFNAETYSVVQWPAMSLLLFLWFRGVVRLSLVMSSVIDKNDDSGRPFNSDDVCSRSPYRNIKTVRSIYDHLVRG